MVAEPEDVPTQSVHGGLGRQPGPRGRLVERGEQRLVLELLVAFEVDLLEPILGGARPRVAMGTCTRHRCREDQEGCRCRRLRPTDPPPAVGPKLVRESASREHQDEAGGDKQRERERSHRMVEAVALAQVTGNGPGVAGLGMGARQRPTAQVCLVGQFRRGQRVHVYHALHVS